MAGCTRFDVITVLRQKYPPKVTGYEVRVEADQAERPPQVFTAVRIHHVVTGFEIHVAALEEAIRLSEENIAPWGPCCRRRRVFTQLTKSSKTRRVDLKLPRPREYKVENLVQSGSAAPPLLRRLRLSKRPSLRLLCSRP